MLKKLIMQTGPYRREEMSVVSDICVYVQIFRILCTSPARPIEILRILCNTDAIVISESNLDIHFAV